MSRDDKRREPAQPLRPSEWSAETRQRIIDALAEILMADERRDDLRELKPSRSK